MSKRKKKPKRLFKARRLDPEIEAAIAHILGSVAPEQRPAAWATIRAVFDPTFVAMLARSSPVTRGGLLLSLHHAYLQLAGGKPCDFCGRGAESIRFALCPDLGPMADRAPAGSAMTGFMLLCPDHARMGPAALEARTIAKMGRMSEGMTELPGMRPAFVGKKIGGATGLNPRDAPATCSDCGAAIWIDRDETDVLDPRDFTPILLCGECAVDRLREDNLDPIPVIRNANHASPAPRT
jgi:hypothetical protein